MFEKQAKKNQLIPVYREFVPVLARIMNDHS